MGNLVFKKEILIEVMDKKGRMVPAEIPYVFRDKNVEVARANAEALIKAKKKSLVMLDSRQFFKDRLENI
jgi:hypothetical protein